MGRGQGGAGRSARLSGVVGSLSPRSRGILKNISKKNGGFTIDSVPGVMSRRSGRLIVTKVGADAFNPLVTNKLIKKTDVYIGGRGYQYRLTQKGREVARMIK